MSIYTKVAVGKLKATIKGKFTLELKTNEGRYVMDKQLGDLLGKIDFKKKKIMTK